MLIATRLSRPLAANLAALTASFILVLAAVTQVSGAVLSDTAELDGNAWETGSVVLTENNNGQALFDAQDITPGSYNETQCVTVTYEGSITPADVVFYADADDNQLAQELQVQIDRGTADVDAGPDCTGFSSNEQIYNGSLDGLPENFAGGAGQWEASNTDDLRSYQFTVSLPSTDPALFNQTATADFVWEAQVD